MKKALLVTTLFFAITFDLLLGQSPQLINYQGVARNVSGAPITNQNISLRMTIRSGSPIGNVEYQETHSVTTSNLGLFTLKIGNGSTSSGAIVNIDWANSTHFLEIEMDQNGSSNYIQMGTSQLVSVPYALHATTVEIDQVNDEDADSLNELQTLGINGDTISLSNGGGSVVIANDSDWIASGVDLFNGNSGNVGIGVINPSANLSVKENLNILDCLVRV